MFIVSSLAAQFVGTAVHISCMIDYNANILRHALSYFTIFWVKVADSSENNIVFL